MHHFRGNRPYMYEWYNLKVKHGGAWGTLGLRACETGLFDRKYIAICSSAGQWYQN